MVEKIKNRFIQQFKTNSFSHVSRVSMLSEAFPTNFTPSGGEEHLAKILAKKNPKESFCVIQPCFRYQDIDNISSGIHAPLFEMGVSISVNELTLKDMIAQFFVLFDAFGLDREKLKISILDNSRALNRHIERDEEAKKIWEEFGIQDSQFQYLGLDENFFMLPDQGYAGIKTEAFYNHYGMMMELAVFIYLSDSVVHRDNEYYLSEFKHNVICFGVGIERWAMIIEEKDSLMLLDENQALLKLYSEDQNVSCFSFSNMEFIALLTKGLLFLCSDGAGAKSSNKDQAKLFRKVTRQLLECCESNDNYKIIKPMLEANAKAVEYDYRKVSSLLNIKNTLKQIQIVQNEYFDARNMEFISS